MAKKHPSQDRSGTPQRRGRVREPPEAGKSVITQMHKHFVMTCASAGPAAGEEIGTRLGRGGRVESGDGRAEHPSGVFPRARAAREPIVRNRGSSCHGARWRRNRHRAPWRLRTPTLDGLLRPPPSEGHPPPRVRSSPQGELLRLADWLSASRFLTSTGATRLSPSAPLRREGKSHSGWMMATVILSLIHI